MIRAMGAGAMVHAMGGLVPAASEEPGAAVFELRVYHTAEGKLPALQKRFREHTDGLFAKHGIKSVAYWTPIDGFLAAREQGRTLVYVLKYPGREEATRMWKAFAEDPEWIRVKTESEKDGALVEEVESTFMELTDFSPKA
jgi:hypothetical protein